jgi:glycogen debranching enzyme
MVRVMACYPQGPAFTNDPGISSNVVGRDAAWYVYGNDHFLPHFSRALLDTFARLQYPSGKIPEYYDALDGRVEDYGLNINDDTPLFILAVNHHFRCTGDLDWLRGIYPAVVKAARYIVAQEDDRGLVFCSSKDPRGDIWAIASWRNIIPGYSLNGAVTEINAECAAALRATGHLAREQGLSHEESQEFFSAALQLRDAMNTHLLNPANGLYYLNIDADGNVHTDVTGDEVFPVMFGVCDEDTGFRIISRLNSPDFWTPGGLRTASQHDPLYDPFAYVGLIGGVWPGLTWWYAFAAARYYPEFMVKALRSSFEHYAADPRANNTVPGQFSEWFDGENLTNRGMRLSPWEPPRFLRAAVEGVCGLMLTPDLPSITPLVPPSWKWVALRRLPYHGRELTYFAAREGEFFHLYANADVQATHDKDIYDEDISAQVHAVSPSAAVVALRRSGEIMVLVGNTGTQTGIVPINLGGVINLEARYDVRIYNSERGAWEPSHRESGSGVVFLALPIETNGFRAIQLKEIQA